MSDTPVETQVRELVERELVAPIQQAAELFIRRVAEKCEALTPAKLARLRRDLAAMRACITTIEPQHAAEYEEGDHETNEH